MKVKGFTVIVLLIVIAIMAILVTTIVTVLVKINKSQMTDKDAETVVQALRTARDQTLSSKNDSAYGVYIASSTVTLFAGTVYSASNSTNQIFTLGTSDLVVGLNLNGGGSSVLFQRLTGATNQSGTITISSPSSGFSRTITIYTTGIIEAPNL